MPYDQGRDRLRSPERRLPISAHPDLRLAEILLREGYLHDVHQGRTLEEEDHVSTDEEGPTAAGEGGNDGL